MLLNYAVGLVLLFTILVTCGAAGVPRHGSSVSPTIAHQSAHQTNLTQQRSNSTVGPTMAYQPESQTRCERLQSAGMAIYGPAYELNELSGNSFCRNVPPEEEVSDLLCRVAVVENLDELSAAMEPFPGYSKPLRPSEIDLGQLCYIFVTGVFKRFFGGLDHVEDRVNFVQAFVDFVRDNNLGNQPEPVPYETAHAFTTRLVEDFGENFLRTLAKGWKATEALWRSRGQSINETDVIQADKLALALSGPLTDPVLFAETSKLSVDTSETVLWVIERVTDPMANEAYPILKRLIAAKMAFLRTADDLGLLDLRVSV